MGISVATIRAKARMAKVKAKTAKVKAKMARAKGRRVRMTREKGNTARARTARARTARARKARTVRARMARARRASASPSMTTIAARIEVLAFCSLFSMVRSSLQSCLAAHVRLPEAGGARAGL